jgi:hypothetical protein
MAKTTRARPAPTTRAPVSPAPPAAAARWGQGRNQAGYKVTTVRLLPDQWQWLRLQALKHAMATNGTADASAILRDLVAGAMRKDPAAR